MSFFSSLTPIDVIYAAILAYILFFFITNIGKLLNKPQEETTRYYTSAISGEKELNIFSALFPIPTVTFKGIVYKKGQVIRILTFNNKVLEGKLLGANDKGMLCVITKRYAIAHNINEILNIDAVSQESIDEK